jgi:hypothetical protein
MAISPTVDLPLKIVLESLHAPGKRAKILSPRRGETSQASEVVSFPAPVKTGT